jgi:citrate lyase subunit beta/citryl-CoA lyase
LLGLATGGEDLALALGALPTPAVLHLPKLLVHYAAKARGLLSLGLLRSVADYSDLDAIRVAVREAREHGFDGATCVHPSIVPLLNTGFSPSAEELDWARRVLALAEQNAGAFALDGTMVDAPVIARARRMLEPPKS